MTALSVIRDSTENQRTDHRGADHSNELIVDNDDDNYALALLHVQGQKNTPLLATAPRGAHTVSTKTFPASTAYMRHTRVAVLC